MNRIKNTFAKLKGRGEKALILYLMAGDPDLDRTYELILTLDRAGVDILEIGVPFSDPTADGPTIQAAGGPGSASDTPSSHDITAGCQLL